MRNAELLADVFDHARQLTTWYLSKLDDLDPIHQFEVDGTRLNCKLWICAHLTWAEWGLVVQPLTGAEPPREWLRQFSFGSPSEPAETWPTFDDVRAAMDEVHAMAMEAIRAIDDVTEPMTATRLRWTDERRKIISHAIRHEGTHAGHLGWLAKLHGAKTV
jgi:hypothetical protein